MKKTDNEYALSILGEFKDFPLEKEYVTQQILALM